MNILNNICNITDYIFSDSKIEAVFEILPFSALAAVIYFILRLSYLKLGNVKRKPIWKELAYGLFVCYCFSVLALVWTPEPFWYELYHGMDFSGSKSLMFGGEYKNNRMLYRCIFGDLKDNAHEKYMIAANIALFVPLGIFLPILFKRLKWWQVILMGFGATCIVELVQPVFGRTGDVDDVITNTIGAVIGGAVGKLLLLLFRERNINVNKKYKI